VFVDAPPEVCERRDPKGMYATVRRGQLKHFTGIDAPYERPPHPDVRLDTVANSVEDGVEMILRVLD
jgi:adenylylsulfate kinase-like enzyme